MFEAFLENHIATVGATFFILAYARGIYDLFKAKSASGREIWFWSLINVAVSMLFVNSVFLFIKYGTYGYLIMESANFGMAVVMLFMSIYYKRKGAK